MKETRIDSFPYLPHTDADRLAMLSELGVKSFDELVSLIPSSIRAKELKLPPGLSEIELTEQLSSLALKNKPASAQACFLGAGSYRRFVPSIVPAIVSRSEFATAYTPYQAEVSQGTLQSIYEFQTAICLLTGMEVANASIYDGPTACAEAALMACRITGKQKIVLSESVNSEYRQVAETYARASGIEFANLPQRDGQTVIIDVSDKDSSNNGGSSNKLLDAETAAVIVQYPNFFGLIEDLNAIADAAHNAGALLVVISDPISLGYLTAPGQFQADIVVGDAQQCGNYLSFGGPSAGYMACRKDFVRQLPGRLAGMTVDIEGKRAFTLTLQTREQHIRRAKATSNICTNQALNALAMLVYLTAMGPKGLQQIGQISMRRAHYLCQELTAIKGVTRVFNGPFFNEFVISTSKPSTFVLEELVKNGILGGVDLSTADPAIENGILIAVTELNSRAQLDQYVQALRDIVSNNADVPDAVNSEAVALARFDKTSTRVK